MSYDIDLLLSLNPHSCKGWLINLCQALALQSMLHLNQDRQLGKGGAESAGRKQRQPEPHQDTLPMLVWDSELLQEESLQELDELGGIS